MYVFKIRKVQSHYIWYIFLIEAKNDVEIRNMNLKNGAQYCRNIHF